MKKLLMIAAALLLCSCAGKESSPVRTVESCGRVYTVDTENQTITYEGVVYSFDIESSGGQGYSVHFTAPDGATSFWNEDGMGGVHQDGGDVLEENRHDRPLSSGEWRGLENSFLP